MRILSLSENVEYVSIEKWKIHKMYKLSET